MQLFSADAIVFSKKKLKIFLTPKTWKNRPQKLLIIAPNFFLCTGPAAQTAQKQKSCTNKSPLMQNWVDWGFKEHLLQKFIFAVI